MIKKLPENKDKVFKTETGEYLTIPELSIPKPVSDKINELVDAVNELQESQNTYWTDIAEIKKELQTRPENVQPDAESRPENVQDKFAEQRRWIGKLCKFWFADAEHPTFGILDFVDAGPHPEPFHINCGESEQGWYPHCEPVKQDDDIIYRGE